MSTAKIQYARRVEPAGNEAADGVVGGPNADFVRSVGELPAADQRVALRPPKPLQLGGTVDSPPAVQRQDANDADGSDELPPVREVDVDGATLEAAVDDINAAEFRIDWIRNLQRCLDIPAHMLSVDGSVDLWTVAAIADFQEEIGMTPTGQIDAETRMNLEAAFEVLQTPLIGEHTDPRVLVEGGVGTQRRYNYYRSIIEEVGGVFLDGNGDINLLAIRGVEADGEEGALEIRQTASAGEYQEAYEAEAAGEELDSEPRHFSGRGRWDDLIVSLWVERDEEGEVIEYHVRERLGSVDPASVLDDEDYGTAHLRDGQYLYELGWHGTESEGHVEAIVEEYEDSDVLDVHIEETNKAGEAVEIRYRALVPAQNIEVIRDSDESGENDLFITEEEFERSREEIAERVYTAVDKGTAINIHSDTGTYVSSLGCVNVPLSEFEEFIREIREIDESEDEEQVYFTLIDASKVELTVSAVVLF